MDYEIKFCRRCNEAIYFESDLEWITATDIESGDSEHFPLCRDCTRMFWEFMRNKHGI